MRPLNEMTLDERSLLLYFENCAVDFTGRVDARRMSDVDYNIARRWHDSGFIRFGRIVSADHNPQGQHWCELSDEAWELAHEERRARFERNCPPRYERTEDHHSE